MLNRTGESIYWSANNENLINYLKCFGESYLIQKIVPLLLLSNTPLFIYYIQNFNKIKYDSLYLEKSKELLLNNLRVRSRRLFLLKVRKVLFSKKLNFFVKFLKKKISFTTKVFFVSYGTWFIITIRLLDYKRSKIIIKKKQNPIVLYWKYNIYNQFLHENKSFEIYKKF